MAEVAKWVNLSLLVLYPLAWNAPLMRAGLLPLFSLDEISLLTGLQSLWATDVFLALVVTVFAIFAPSSKPSVWPLFTLACSAVAPSLP